MGFLSKLFNMNNHTNTTIKYNPKASCYKMNTLQEIEAIPIPTERFDYNCDFTESIEYVLQRKATQFKKEGKLDLAIACLKKANMIMPFSPMQYSAKDYERLESYLKLNKQFKEVEKESQNNQKLYKKQKGYLHDKKLDSISTTGIIEVQHGFSICSECAKYHNRIYSKNGLHGFPDVKIFEDYYRSKSCNCILTFYPFWYGISLPTICSEKDLLKYSNRPFIDDRTKKEIDDYDYRHQKEESEKKDRIDYAWLCENIPDNAPKSYGGYRNMKNKNSTNYQKLVALAKENGYTI